jgi:hypothetical protein
MEPPNGGGLRSLAERCQKWARIEPVLSLLGGGGRDDSNEFRMKADRREIEAVSPALAVGTVDWRYQVGANQAR